MPATSTLRTVSRDRRPCFFVQIAGIPVLFGSVAPPDKSYQVDGVAVPYQKRKCIVPGRGFKFSRKLNVRKNTVDCAPVEIVLASTEQTNQTDPLDPARIFGRLGFPGADAVMELAAEQSIPHINPPIAVTMADDPATVFSVGDVVHVGREAFVVGAINSGSNEITLSDRNILGTRREFHKYDTQSRVPLIMTKPVVFFRNRRAVIFEGTVGDDEVGRDWVERWRGFVTNEPEVSTSGKVPTVTIHISPLTALLDVPLGAPNEAIRFNRRAHSFTGTFKAFTFREGVERGALLDASTGIDDDYLKKTGWENAGYVPMTREGAQRWASLRATTANVDAHPFGIPVNVSRDEAHVSGDVLVFAGVSWDKFPPNTDIENQNTQPLIIGGDTRTWADFLSRDALAIITTSTSTPLYTNEDGSPLVDGRVRNARMSHYRDILLRNTVLWPDALRDAINNSGEDGEQGMGGEYPRGGAVDAVTKGGGFVSLYLDVERRKLRLKCSLVGATVNLTWHHKSLDVDYQSNRQNKRWSISDTGVFNPSRESSIPPRAKLTPLAFGIDEQDETNEVSVDVVGRVPGDTNSKLVPVKIASAWYQKGEPYILLDAMPAMTASGQNFLSVYHPKDGMIGTFKMLAGGTITLADGTPAYQVQVDEANYADSALGDMPSFAEYPGEERIEFKPSAVFSASDTIGETILQMLCSSGGMGWTSSEYDKLPYGGGLEDGTGSQFNSIYSLGKEIDVASFLAIESPIPNSQFRPVWQSGQTIREAVGGLLQAAGYVADIITNEAGECRLTAIPLGFPNKSAVISAFTEGDIVDRPNPQSKTEFAQANVFEFRYDYDFENNPRKTQRVKDAVSIDVSGEERSLTIPLPGVVLSENLDIVSQLRPIFSRLRYELSLPRRVFEFHLRGGLAMQACIGGTYSVTHSLLRNVNSLGLAGALCRMRSIHHDGWKAAARTELVFYGQAGAGWAPSCSVIGVPSSTRLTVLNAQHSSSPAPGGSGTVIDASGFSSLSAGDKCLLIKRGDMDFEQVVEIASISAGAHSAIINLTAEHTLVADGSNVVGYLVSMRTSSGTVPEDHQQYAQIGTVTIS